jgi:hypothetical protein
VSVTTIFPPRTRRKRSRAAWTVVVLGVVLLLLRGIFDFAFDRLTGQIVAHLSSFAAGSTKVMAEGGWLTVAFLPLAIVVFQEDRHRRYGQPTSTSAQPDATGTVHLTTRVRADTGHGIAPRSSTYWLRRVPLLLAILAAILFWPLTGVSMARTWMASPGGDAFSDGWRISLAATAVAVLVLLAEPWLNRRWLWLPVARTGFVIPILPIALPMIALVITLIIR